MEQWEKELREKLEAELPEKGYDISTPGFHLYTGKRGYIEYRVQLVREIRKPRSDE